MGFETGILVINFNDSLPTVSRTSFLDASRRWGCQYCEITEDNCPQYLLNEIQNRGSTAPNGTYLCPSRFLKYHPFELCGAYRVLVLDSDTIVRSDCPSPFSLFKEDALAIVDACLTGCDLSTWEQYYQRYRQTYRLPENYTSFNSGVVLANRRYHSDLYKLATKISSEIDIAQWPEQTALNLAAASLGTELLYMPDEWNLRVEPTVLEYIPGYILHLAGVLDKKNILNNTNWYAPPILTRDVFGQLLNKLELVGKGAEIGVWTGNFSKQILETWIGETLFSIDAWEYQASDYHSAHNFDNCQHEMNFNETKQKLAKFGKRSSIIKGFSQQVANQFDDASLDFVYIDANHSYLSTLQDIKSWYPKVKDGGVMAGHDFLSGNIRGSEFGVRRAVHDFLSSSDSVIYATPEEFPSWFFRKGRYEMVVHRE